ncbi:hypothetical protein ACFQ08_28125 [Streptosporangium algeriense]|uniref:RNA polymerase sigma factor 70 region 4 type 2 domain-containing protein n=1 Tax=Streptosporangium algeriense TaxID=1682748 RepID=A0ABW3DZ33_9ACTN
MRRYTGYRDFIQRDQRLLVGTALLLTGSHDQALRLALWSLRSVGLSWPPTLWENPTVHAQVTMYRRYLRRPVTTRATALLRLPPVRRVIAVACLHDGRTHEEVATILGLSQEAVETEVAEAVAVLGEAYLARLAEHGHAGLLDRSLLRPFEIEQECRELIYAARHLPRWRYAPMGVLRSRYP